MTESLWKLNMETKEPTAPILEYIKKQALDLKVQTNGRVIAKFTEIRLNGLIKQASMLLTKNGLKKDASGLYNGVNYTFYITDQKEQYELDVFSLRCNDNFPVHLTIDETIAQEIQEETTLNVTNSESLKNVFVKMIQSRKVVYVINKLSKMADQISEPAQKSL